MKKIFIILLIVASLFAFSYQVNASTLTDTINILELEAPNFDIAGGTTSCAELLGNNLVLVLRFSINAIRIIGVIVAIVMAMTKLLPAVNKGDAKELNAALRKCIWIAIVLIIVVMFPTLVKIIGKLFGFDISCL